MINFDHLNIEAAELANKIVKLSADIVEARAMVKDMDTKADNMSDDDWKERMELRSKAIELTNHIYVAEEQIRLMTNVREINRAVVANARRAGFVF